MPSLEVISAKLEAHIQECTHSKEKFETSIDNLRLSLEAKVPWSHFWTIFTILVTLLVGVFGFISYQINGLSTKVDDINKVSVSTQTDVSYLKGKLAPYNVEYTK